MLAIGPFVTPEKALVCTLTSNGYKFLTLNLVRLLQKAAVPWKLCIVCADRASYRFFRQEGIPCLLATSPFPDNGPTSAPVITPFGCRTFQQLNLKKLELLAELAGPEHPEINYVVYMDGDIAVYSDFLPDILERLRQGPQRLLMQCDEQTRVDCSGNMGTAADGCPNACTGFVAWMRGEGHVPPALFQVAGEESTAMWRECPEDQIFVNRRARALGIPFATLPRDKYPNGMFVRLRGSGVMPDALLLHYNWRVGESKRGSMMVNGDWVVPY
jgi:hypothetical protein